MKIFPKTRAAFKYGEGLSYFIRGKYKKAIELIEHSNALDPGSKENTWHTYSVLGRSYLALGDIGKAEKLIERALKMFEQKKKSNQDDFDKDEYRATLKAYEKIKNRNLDNESE